MASKVIQISLSSELLAKINEAALEESVSRSEFIRSAVVERLKTIAEYHTKLAAALTQLDAPTEDDILNMLQLRGRRRKAAEYQLQRRRELRAWAEERRRQGLA